MRHLFKTGFYPSKFLKIHFTPISFWNTWKIYMKLFTSWVVSHFHSFSFVYSLHIVTFTILSNHERVNENAVAAATVFFSKEEYQSIRFGFAERSIKIKSLFSIFFSFLRSRLTATHADVFVKLSSFSIVSIFHS